MSVHLAKALHAFQKDAPPIHFDAENDHYHHKFVSLSKVIAEIRPALNKQGLVYTQFLTNIDGLPALETMLIHAESGEDIAAVAPLILAKNDPQGWASAVTYARRYALLSMLGLVGEEDDDAQRASDPHGLRASRADAPQDRGATDLGQSSTTAAPGSGAATPGNATPKQKDLIKRLCKELGLEATDLDALTKATASARIEELMAVKGHADQAAAVAEAEDLAEIPF